MAEGAEQQRTDAGAATATTALSYEDASARVEAIVRRLDSGEASLSETLELVKEGKMLIERCASELDAVSGALEELRLEDLVARLEAKAQ
jgi:exodeoxyribonuclease VII small subunit